MKPKPMTSSTPSGASTTSGRSTCSRTTGEFADESTPTVRPTKSTSRSKSHTAGRRLEHGIELRCCGVPCKLVGNLALRGAAGSPDTRLGYECTRCHRRLQVVDDWGWPSAEQLTIYDETP